MQMMRTCKRTPSLHLDYHLVDLRMTRVEVITDVMEDTMEKSGRKAEDDLVDAEDATHPRHLLRQVRVLSLLLNHGSLGELGKN